MTLTLVPTTPSTASEASASERSGRARDERTRKELRVTDDTPVAFVILQAQAEAARHDGTSFDLLRRGFDAFKDCEVPQLARVRMKLAAGIVECQLIARLPALAKMFPDPAEALTMRGLARAATLLGDDELVAAGPLLAGAIEGAVRAFAADNFDASRWLYVLSALLTPDRPHMPPDNFVVIASLPSDPASQGGPP